MDHFIYSSELLINTPFIGVWDLMPIINGLILFAGLMLFFKLLQTVILQKLKKVSLKTSNDFDDLLIEVISDIKPFFYVFLSLYLASRPFSLSNTIDEIWTGFAIFVVTWQFISAAGKFVNYSIRKFIEKDEDEDGVIDPNTANASGMLSLIAQILLWVMGGLFVLSNLGIEVTSLIAGLGIGGVAIAFALQGILSDLFASFSIYFDKPFRIGDFIIIGTDSGTVEKIGIKSTRIRTLQGEELVISNAELTTARVQNFKKMAKRRIVTKFGITYETPPEKVAEVPKLVADIFTDLPAVNLDRVHFASLADSALIFEVVYFVQSSDYIVYMESQQQYNLALLEKMAAAGIQFAYPTQTIYHQTLN